MFQYNFGSLDIHQFLSLKLFTETVIRVNALYVCHDDAWGQTGGITMVDGEIYSVSARQKNKHEKFNRN